MSKRGLTKIYHMGLEFVFDHEQHKLFVRDHIYHKEYELRPTGAEGLPFEIILNKFLEAKI